MTTSHHHEIIGIPDDLQLRCRHLAVQEVRDFWCLDCGAIVSATDVITGLPVYQKGCCGNQTH